MVYSSFKGLAEDTRSLLYNNLFVRMSQCFTEKTSMSCAQVFSLILVGTSSLINGFILEKESDLLHHLTEKFEMQPLDKADCKWIEHRNPGAGPREFRINCRLGQGKSYNCIYKANPHSCGWYNQGNQHKYYRGLAREAATNQPNACNRHSLEYKKCPDVHFQKLN